MIKQLARGTIVLNYGGDTAGILTGGQRPCTLEGCTGLRLATRWPDGRLTFPCTEGMAFDPDRWEWRKSVATREPVGEGLSRTRVPLPRLRRPSSLSWG